MIVTFQIPRMKKNPVLGVPLWKLSRSFWEIEKQSFFEQFL